MLAAADQYNSEETEKHVTRTMLENARQGFWNGSQPPFGYRTVEAEKRGQTIKKRLEVEEREAATVRRIFKLFLEGDGTKGPMGVKDITSWLNCNGFRNRSGNPYYKSIVYAILTRSAYSGVYYYNTCDSRTRREQPQSEWVPVKVPRIVTLKAFSQVQELLYTRRPNVTPPRITNSEVLLTGLVRCEGCGGPMMLRTGTGKSGKTYRYYACAGRALKGSTVCGQPVSVPETQLDELVLSALASQLLTPARLTKLLNAAICHRRKTSSESRTRKAALEKQRKEIDGQIDRLITAVADGSFPDMTQIRVRIDELTARRDECTRLLAMLESDVPEYRQALSKQQAVSISDTSSAGSWTPRPPSRSVTSTGWSQISSWTATKPLSLARQRP